MQDPATGQQLDYELKFDVPPTLAVPVLDAVRGRCQPDPSYPEAFVSSIYYDTRDFDLLGEKINSDYLKTKVRLRWYELEGRAQGEGSFVEIKRRVGNRRTKLRLRSPATASSLARVPLDTARLPVAEAMLLEAGVDTPRRLVPMITVRYHRRRFVDPASGARVSIDSRLEVPRVNHSFLARIGPVRLRNAVVEVKGPHRDLPRTLRILTDLGCRRSSFSKYATCYRQLRPHNNRQSWE